MYGHICISGLKQVDREDVHRVNGHITSLCTNNRGNRTYGFILGENHQDYFFHKNDLINCSMSQLQEGDSVEFEPEANRNDPSRLAAKDVRMRTTSAPAIFQYATPGIHPSIEMEKFNQEEQKIIRALGKALYVTNGGRELTVASCRYRYILVKPTEDYAVNFNLQREIPVIFSDYKNFEPRSLDVAADVAKIVPARLRLDRSCQIIISSAHDIEEKIGELLRDSNLSSVVIPFSYEEFMSDKMSPAF